MNDSVIVCLQLFAVLNHLAKEEGTDDNNKSIIESFLSTHFSGWGVGVQERSLLLKYVLMPKKIPDITLSLPEEKLRLSVQEIYDVLCEHFGPNKTDSIFQRSINKTAKSNEAKRYHPKNLL